MTVIAWDGTTLAADKQCTNNGYKTTVTKIYRFDDGRLVGAASHSHICVAFIEWLRRGGNIPDILKSAKEEKVAGAGIEILPNGKIHRYQIGVSSIPLHFEDKFIAIGSGFEYAVGAMAMGADAIKAVEITSRFSSSCGMGVDSLRLNE